MLIIALLLIVVLMLFYLYLIGFPFRPQQGSPFHELETALEVGREPDRPLWVGAPVSAPLPVPEAAPEPTHQIEPPRVLSLAQKPASSDWPSWDQPYYSGHSVRSPQGRFAFTTRRRKKPHGRPTQISPRRRIAKRYV